MKASSEDKHQIRHLSVVIERPEASDIKQFKTENRYELLKKQAEKARQDLIDWLDQHGLNEQVERIGEATAFNVLFVDATDEVEARLKEAPGVKGVARADGFKLKF